MTWIGDFLSRAEATPESATAIAEMIREHFEGSELATNLIGPLEDWMTRGDAPADELDATLRWGSDWLERSGIR